MTKQPPPIEFSQAAPELQRLAEEVHASRQPRSIQKDGQTIAVVMPVASQRIGKLVEPGDGEGVTSKRVTTMEGVETMLTLPSSPSPEEIARRQALVKQILANRERRNIAPLTSADLVHQVREEEYRSYDDWC
ncbi:MAG: hypothetical protein M3442_07860 [Chloroflexota bacterium]|nr:hypothetical protein [Chloroflexota bacterium]